MDKADITRLKEKHRQNANLHICAVTTEDYKRIETEVLKLISQGHDSQNIAAKLFISVNTVNNHRQRILHKTKTENTTQALLYAKKAGII